MNDNDIIELYWLRNETAISESQSAYGAYCYAIAIRILSDRSDSEECVNDTWFNAWNAIPPQRPVKLSSFFGRITRNLSLNRYAERHAAKRGGSEVELALEELEDCVGDTDTTEQLLTDSELEKSVNLFLHTLPERECNIFLCRYWDLKSLKDIAEKYGMKVNAVKASLFRSREKLRTHLKKEGFIL